MFYMILFCSDMKEDEAESIIGSTINKNIMIPNPDNEQLEQNEYIFLCKRLQGYISKEKELDAYLSAINYLELSLMKEESTEEAQETALEELITIAIQKGYTYPVTMVQSWTNRLNAYNQQLEQFMTSIEELSDNVDPLWLANKVKSFSDRIN